MIFLGPETDCNVTVGSNNKAVNIIEISLALLVLEASFM